MALGRHPVQLRNNFWVALTLLGILLICYANSFEAAWQYDDFVNIVHNDRVHMTQLSAAQVYRAINAGPASQTIGRPLAYLSFALNYRWGQQDVFGYHLVNLTIHWLAGFFLFLWIRGTLTLPLFQGRYQTRATLIAWLAALFWAVHPIQVSAVTFIVQRMASMAGLFYVVAMYGYLNGRRADSRSRKWLGYGICALGTTGALLSKENAVLLPYALILYELFFFQEWDAGLWRKAFLWTLVVSVALFGLSFLYMDMGELRAPLAYRPFTRIERLMTQPRVLFIYLSLIALPMTLRMTLLHDVAVSRSLLEPWTTLPSLAGLLIGLTLLVLLARRHRLFAFCGLFFFLNHAVESSFLNLELIYEHRNYIPSMLLFVPVAVAVVRSIDFFYYRRSLQAGIACGIGLLVVSSMQTTFGYNAIFRSEYTLWQHNIELYPRKSVAYTNLGKVMAQTGNVDRAYDCNLKAVTLDNFNNYAQKGISYYNLGLFAENVKKDLHQAVDYLRTAQRYADLYPKVWQELAQVHIKLGDFEKAGQVIADGLKKWPDDSRLLILAALKNLKEQRYGEALDTSEKVLRAGAVDEKMALMVMAQSYRYQGRMPQAVDVWERLLRKHPDNVPALMALIELSSELKRAEAAEKYGRRLIKLKGMDRLMRPFELVVDEHNMMPYIPNLEIIKRVLHSLGSGAPVAARN